MSARARLFRWSKLLVGEFLGTTGDQDPRFHYLRHIEDRTQALRAEVNALTRILIEKGIVTRGEAEGIFEEEFALQCKALEAAHPGATATEDGIVLDPGRIADITQWMGNWPK